MQKRKIVAVAVLLAVVVLAMVGYEVFVANSLSGYTKITLNPYTNPPCSVKFGNTTYYIIFFLIGNTDEWGMPSLNTPPDPYFQVTTKQTLIVYRNQSFTATPGARYSFEGLQIVVGSVNTSWISPPNPLYQQNTDQLILYVKSTTSSSAPIVSPIATPISPTPTPIPEVPIPAVTPPYIIK